MLSLQNPARSRSAPARSTIRRWAEAALREPAQVTVRIVGSAEGRRLNAYRGSRHATNVLSFAYGRDGGVLHGDLVLCAPVVAREAREQGKRLLAHYAHLVVHGMLHLQGEDHETEPAAQRMERRETIILRRLGHPDPYRHRSERTGQS
jgi:probable rRNA maturation factor